MAKDFVQITRNVTTATEAPNVLSAINQLRAGIAAVTAVRDKMIHCQDGSDFSQVETVFGVPNPNGQHVFTLFDGAVQNFESNGYVQDLINSVG